MNMNNNHSDTLIKAANEAIGLKKENDKLRIQNEKLLKMVKQLKAGLQFHGVCNCEYRHGARCPSCQTIYEADKLINNIEADIHD